VLRGTFFRRASRRRFLPAVEDGATVRTIVFSALAELIHPAKLIFRVAVAVRRGIDEPRHGLGIIGLYAELKASAISELIKETSGQEQALYVLLAATGMRVSEARAVEIPHFTNDGRTINVEQQVKKDSISNREIPTNKVRRGQKAG
jgi:integrase